MKPSLTTRQWHLTLWPLLVLISLSVISWSPRGLLHLRQLYREYHELIEKNHSLEEENHRLYLQIDRLCNDPKALEHLARKDLGLAKEGELIFQFLPSGDTSTSHTR